MLLIVTSHSTIVTGSHGGQRRYGDNRHLQTKSQPLHNTETYTQSGKRSRAASEGYSIQFAFITTGLVQHFIDHVFQNWTRTSADILGTVFLHVDYRVPLEAVRAEFERILRDSPYWDGKVQVVQVTEAREHTLEIRALASAADASLAWDLRCEVREKLVAFLQREHPESLPRLRAELRTLESAAFR